MRFRRRVECVFAAALIAVAGATGSKAAPLESERMNVLFISVDDLRPELGAYGAPVVTPNIDRLADAGLRFDHAYAQVSACAASRAALLTGTYPHTSGVYLMRPSLGEANPGLVTMPQLFKDAGYETMLPRGPVTEGADVSDDTYLDGKLAAHAVAELRRLKDRPFFLAVGFVRPHLPFNCPRRYWDLYDRRNIVLPDTISRERVPLAQWHGNYEPAMYQGGRTNSQLTGRRLIHGYRA
ncbi:MAG: sulfatase-like hydrolase/transferase, partial [Deltaproteobacteria bacterium]|nr:sulfatase-like hydrolase/transferase [Deltaproteobacteria bacterium]